MKSWLALALIMKFIDYYRGGIRKRIEDDNRVTNELLGEDY